jgi:tRNA (cmo5U34)-methyltransferase
LEKVKNHFEAEAKEFDGLILKLIPYYHDMINALVTALPFKNLKPIKVLDLGSGTGNISKAVKERFPKAQITCIDLAENMVEMARFKLSKYDDIEYHVADFCEFEFSDDYDAVVSSLALHHLQTDQTKKAVYNKIYNALKKGGVFYNADTILGSTDYLDDIFMQKWKEFMLKSLPPKEIQEKWLPQYYQEDFPAPLMDHLDWLREAGFRKVDVIWKYYKGAVFGGLK